MTGAGGPTLSPEMANAISWALKAKQWMLDSGKWQATGTCPVCGTKGAVRLSIARSNKHLHCACGVAECTFSLME